MPLVATSHGEVSYTVAGPSTGLPIVLLHATLHSSNDFSAIIPTLSQTHHVIAIDWPFHGLSPHPTVPSLPTATFFAKVLEEVVTALRLPPAILIGNSVGGYAAANLAITHPQLVRGLVLVNTGGFVPWGTVSRIFTRVLGVSLVCRLLAGIVVPRYMAPRTPLDHEITSQVTELAKSVEGSMIWASLWRSFLGPEYDLRGRAAEVKCPVLVVWGNKDGIVPLRVGRATAEVLGTRARLEVLDAGHVVFASRPEEFLKLLTTFTREVSGGKGNEPINA
jgi:pimeloyl-ACP methyl ester carboxylesterase